MIHIRNKILIRKLINKRKPTKWNTIHGLGTLIPKGI